MHLGDTFESATADFEQYERVKGRDDRKWVQKAVGVQGVLQENGDFMFLITEGKQRKMVRTKNNGMFITAGISLRAATSESEETWSEHSWYRVANINLVKGMSGFLNFHYITLTVLQKN